MLSAAAALVCALNLLGRSTPAAPVRFIDGPPPGVSRSAEAFLLREPATIYLITSTEAFRNARNGPFADGAREGCRKIASIIVHEEWHLRHGSNEEGAYLAQITALNMLQAAPITISGVRQSMARVLARQQGREPQPQMLSFLRTPGG